MSHSPTDHASQHGRRRLCPLWIFIAAAMLCPTTAFAQFRRGDVNDDGRITMIDVCTLNNFLFLGGTLTCADAADVNDDGFLATADSVALLNYLCLPGSPPPPAPGPIVCGLDPTADVLPLCTYTSCAIPMPAPNSRFIRGDCDQDLTVSIGDAVFELNMLFGLSVQSSCMSACDANGDGSFNIADPLFTLTFLFALGPPPPAPFPNCGCDGNCPALIDCASGACP